MMDKNFNLQKVLYLSGNHYESQKSYDKIMDNIYWTFEGYHPFTLENFRREIVHTNISISDSVYGKIKDGSK